MNWSHLGSFLMGSAGTLITIGVLWGTLKSKLEETREDVKEIKRALEPLAPVPQLLQETRSDVRELRERLHDLESRV